MKLCNSVKAQKDFMGRSLASLQRLDSTLNATDVFCHTCCSLAPFFPHPLLSKFIVESREEAPMHCR